MAKKTPWIKAAVAGGKGKLHEHLGLPAGEKIPEARLRQAVHAKDKTIRQEARLAMTLEGFHHKKPEKKPRTERDVRSTLYGKGKD